LVLACDGIWDVLTSQQVCDFVRRRIAQRKPLETICEELMDKCLAPDSDWGGIGCDNMTALIVGLFGDRTKDEWYDWIANRVENKVGRALPPKDPEPYEGPPKNNFGYGGLGRGNPLTGTLAGGSGSLVQAALGRGFAGGFGDGEE